MRGVGKSRVLRPEGRRISGRRKSGDPWAHRWALGARIVLINIYCGRNFVRGKKIFPT